MNKYVSLNVATQELLDNIDKFVLGNVPNTGKALRLPPVVEVRPFKSRRLAARIINKLAYLPLRVIRKSTTPYWNAQRQADYELMSAVYSLKQEVLSLRQQIKELKEEK
jgi:hypothetical protein